MGNKQPDRTHSTTMQPQNTMTEEQVYNYVMLVVREAREKCNNDEKEFRSITYSLIADPSLPKNLEAFIQSYTRPALVKMHVESEHACQCKGDSHYEIHAVFRAVNDESRFSTDTRDTLLANIEKAQRDLILFN